MFSGFRRLGVQEQHHAVPEAGGGAADKAKPFVKFFGARRRHEADIGAFTAVPPDIGEKGLHKHPANALAAVGGIHHDILYEESEPSVPDNAGDADGCPAVPHLAVYSVPARAAAASSSE